MWGPAFLEGLAMTSLSAALRHELPRLPDPARALVRDAVEPARLGLLMMHLWRFMLVLGLALAVFGAEHDRRATSPDGAPRAPRGEAVAGLDPQGPLAAL